MCEAGTTTVYRDEPVSIVEAVAFGDRVHGAVYLHLGLLYVVLGEDVHEDHGLAPHLLAGSTCRSRGRSRRRHRGGTSWCRNGTTALSRVEGIPAGKHQDLLLLLLGLGRRGRRRGLVHVQLRSWSSACRDLLRTLPEEQEEDRDSNDCDGAEDDQGTPVTGRHGHVLTSWRGTGDGGSGRARGALLAARDRAGARARVGGEEVRSQGDVQAGQARPARTEGQRRDLADAREVLE